MVEEDGAFEPDQNGYICPCPMGHNTFEGCIESEDSCFCQLIACGGECVYNEDERIKDEETPPG
ncbi:hypothetical protein MUO79_02790 [Candidatus Bathyarchaeota archaeon]|nr:hypothetical protein [Candidatus Bathyarchaeota archaeon]